MAKKVLFVVAPEDFKDEEFFETKHEIESAGFETETASKGVKKAESVSGKSININIDISKVKTDGYAAVVFVGGPGAEIYLDDKDALSLAESFYKAGKIVSAICIAPVILANAGILKGKKTTVFPSEKKSIESKGAVCTGKNVETDGNIITASGPSASKEFGKTVAKKISGS